MPGLLDSPPPLAARPRRFPWKGVLIVGGLLLAIRLFLLETLTVASGSMEPLLHGDEQSGDRVLVARQIGRLARPDRFDLVVFEREGETARSSERIVVKRVAALGGEALRIVGGELLVRPAGGVERPIVKGYAEFAPLLVPLWRERFAAQQLQDGGEFAIEGDAARFDDGWLAADGTRRQGTNDVADLCFRFDLESDAAELCLAFVVVVAEFRCEFALRPVAGAWRVDLDLVDRTGLGAARTLSGVSAPVATGSPQRFEFWSIDGRIGAAVDGEVAFEQPLDRRGGLLAAGGTVGAARLSAHNGAARLLGLEVARDLFFTAPADAAFACGGEACEVPDGTLFLLGDASDQSVDSRSYGVVPLAALRGRPLAIVAPAGDGGSGSVGTAPQPARGRRVRCSKHEVRRGDAAGHG